jgi:hypothetical protein
MKKRIIALSCLTALLLAGCGVDEPSEAVSVPDPVEIRTTEAPTEPETEPQTEAPTTKRTKTTTKKTTAATTTAAVTTTTTAAEKPTGDANISERLAAYPDLYKAEVQRVWDEIYERSDGMVSITYALYDINKDKIPELLFKHGTCEADFQIDIFTVGADAKLKQTGTLGGGHTSFAYDEKTGELVLVWGHMGSMSLNWFSMNDDYIIQVKDYQHEFEDGEDYQKIMFDMGVWDMTFIGCYSFDKNSKPKSTIYYAYSEYESVDGLYLDFSYDESAFR